MTTETDLELDDGRTLHVYDAGGPPDGLAVFWHHGSPNLGPPPEPLVPAAARLGIRWLSHDRPGYGGSSPDPGRDVAAVADDVARIADALGIARFAVMGPSGGGPHALACAALLPERVLGVVSLAGLAPIEAEGLDWFAGMATGGAAELRAAVAGRAPLEAHLASSVFDLEQFTAADVAALSGPWSWLATISGQAIEAGLGGLVDDDLAFVAPWGFALEGVRAPLLLVHGGEDRIVPCSHSEWLARRCPAAELWLRPADGHVSVLGSAEAALGWLREHSG